ncbi:MAG: hypothetical protein AAFQ98_10980 [Bacteroidota bacterium]
MSLYTAIKSKVFSDLGQKAGISIAPSFSSVTYEHKLFGLQPNDSQFAWAEALFLSISLPSG